MNKIINKIISWKLTILAGLIPLFFLPFTLEFYEFNKNILLLAFSLFFLLLWALKMLLEKRFTFSKTALDLPILFIVIAYLLSNFIAAPNKLEAFWLPNGTGTILALTLLYFTATNVLHEKQDIKRIINALITSGIILSLIAIYQFIGLSEAFINDNSLFVFLKNKAWTPAGNPLSLAIFLVIVFSLISIKIYEAWKNKEKESTSFWLNIFIILLISGGLVLTLYQLFTSAKPILLPYSIGWTIAIEAFKDGKTFLLGVGPRSFLDAFSQFRPLDYNLAPLWLVRFNNSSNFYLQLMTTVGLLGLLSFGYLIWQLIRKQFAIGNLKLPIFLIFIIFIFLPANFILLFVLYLLLALLASHSSNHQYHQEGRTLPWIVFVFFSLITLSSLFFIVRIYAAEIFFKRSLNNLNQNDGSAAYNNQIKAINLNPYYDLYRLLYSQTNLLLADNLASKTDITDQDRQSISVLIQQSITEAKAAISLNKNKITNWENLANTYRQLINVAEGADQWTISSFHQAINLDPINPDLKLRLGGVYYALGNYDEAILWFQKAIDDKVNFANGYYNLSATYREKGDLKKASEMMQMTLNFVPTNSEDYQKARNELDELIKQLPLEETVSETEAEEITESSMEIPLDEPEVLPPPVIVPPLELPEQSGPPTNKTEN